MTEGKLIRSIATFCATLLKLKPQRSFNGDSFIKDTLKDAKRLTRYIQTGEDDD